MGMYKVEICGVNTAKLPLLSEEEKKELFDKIGKGDRAARETFIKGNLRLVLSIIQRFYNSGENIDDLFQAELYLISPITEPARFLKKEYFLICFRLAASD